MSNGISADGERQTKIPLTGERICARLKTGRTVRGMYQDRRIYCANREIVHVDQVEVWEPQRKDEPEDAR